MSLEQINKMIYVINFVYFQERNPASALQDPGVLFDKILDPQEAGVPAFLGLQYSQDSLIITEYLSRFSP